MTTISSLAIIERIFENKGLPFRTKDDNYVQVPLKLGTKTLHLDIYAETYSYEAVLNGFVAFDKIEGQELEQSDIEYMLGSFCDLVAKKQICLVKYELCGKTAYKLNTINNQNNKAYVPTPYETIGKLPIFLFGKRTVLGYLEF